MNCDYVTISNLIIDDIVLPDGRTFMNTLGGAGTHALCGVRVWSDRPGFVATVGEDLDDSHRRTLEALGIDLSGLLVRADYRTTRAWQIFEPDERRIEIFRTDEEAFERDKPTIADLPPDYLNARGFHLHWGTLTELYDLVTALREANPTVRLVWEPAASQLEEPPSRFQAVLPLIDLFSPDIREGIRLTGRQDPPAIAETFLEWGARCVALRMGEDGSLLRLPEGEGWRIPAVPAREIVDVTGAGNSYCGGALTGLGAGLAPLEAALRGAVSASFALEQFGVPHFDTELPAEAARRLERARARVEPL